MNRYILCENLKLKNTFIKKMIFIAPIVTSVLAFLLGGGFNMQNMIFYWWYTFFLPGVIAISAALIHKNEQKAGNYNGIYLIPINLKKVWISKSLILSLYILLSQIIIFLLVLFPKLLGFNGIKFSTGQILLGCLLSWVGSLPQIPLLLYCGKKLGIASIVFINNILGLLIPVLVANKPIWFLFPHSYSGKLLQAIIGLDINGLCIVPNIQNGVKVGFIATICIIITTSVSLYFTSKKFSNMEV